MNPTNPLKPFSHTSIQYIFMKFFYHLEQHIHKIYILWILVDILQFISILVSLLVILIKQKTNLTVQKILGQTQTIKFVIIFLDNDQQIYQILIYAPGIAIILFILALAIFVLVEYNNQYTILQNQHNNINSIQSFSGNNNNNNKNSKKSTLLKLKYQTKTSIVKYCCLIGSIILISSQIFLIPTIMNFINVIDWFIHRTQSTIQFQLTFIIVIFMILSFLLILFILAFNSNRRVFKQTFQLLLVVFHLRPGFYFLCVSVAIQAIFYYYKEKDTDNETNKLILNRSKSNNQKTTTFLPQWFLQSYHKLFYLIFIFTSFWCILEVDSVYDASAPNSTSNNNSNIDSALGDVTLQSPIKYFYLTHLIYLSLIYTFIMLYYFYHYSTKNTQQLPFSIQNQQLIRLYQKKLKKQDKKLDYYYADIYITKYFQREREQAKNKSSNKKKKKKLMFEDNILKSISQWSEKEFKKLIIEKIKFDKTKHKTLEGELSYFQNMIALKLNFVQLLKELFKFLEEKKNENLMALYQINKLTYYIEKEFNSVIQLDKNYTNFLKIKQIIELENNYQSFYLSYNNIIELISQIYEKLLNKNGVIDEATEEKFISLTIEKKHLEIILAQIKQTTGNKVEQDLYILLNEILDPYSKKESNSISYIINNKKLQEKFNFSYITVSNRLIKYVSIKFLSTFAYKQDFLVGQDYSIIFPQHFNNYVDLLVEKKADEKIFTTELLIKNHRGYFELFMGTFYFLPEFQGQITYLIKFDHLRQSQDKSLMYFNCDTLCIESFNKKMISAFSLSLEKINKIFSSRSLEFNEIFGFSNVVGSQKKKVEGNGLKSENNQKDMTQDQNKIMKIIQGDQNEKEFMNFLQYGRKHKHLKGQQLQNTISSNLLSSRLKGQSVDMKPITYSELSKQTTPLKAFIRLRQISTKPKTAPRNVQLKSEINFQLKNIYLKVIIVDDVLMNKNAEIIDRGRQSQSIITRSEYDTALIENQNNQNNPLVTINNNISNNLSTFSTKGNNLSVNIKFANLSENKNYENKNNIQTSNSKQFLSTNNKSLKTSHPQLGPQLLLTDNSKNESTTKDLKKRFENEKFLCQISNPYRPKILERLNTAKQTNRITNITFIKLTFLLGLLIFLGCQVTYKVLSNNNEGVIQQYQSQASSLNKQYQSLLSAVFHTFIQQHLVSLKSEFINQFQRLNITVNGSYEKAYNAALLFHNNSKHHFIKAYSDSYLQFPSIEGGNQVPIEFKTNWFTLLGSTQDTIIYDYFFVLIESTASVTHQIVAQNFPNVQKIIRHYEPNGRYISKIIQLSFIPFMVLLCGGIAIVVVFLIIYWLIYQLNQVRSDIKDIYKFINRRQLQKKNEYIEQINIIMQNVMKSNGIQSQNAMKRKKRIATKKNISSNSQEKIKQTHVSLLKNMDLSDDETVMKHKENMELLTNSNIKGMDFLTKDEFNVLETEFKKKKQPESQRISFLNPRQSIVKSIFNEIGNQFGKNNNNISNQSISSAFFQDDPLKSSSANIITLKKLQKESSEQSNNKKFLSSTSSFTLILDGLLKNIIYLVTLACLILMMYYEYNFTQQYEQKYIKAFTYYEKLRQSNYFFRLEFVKNQYGSYYYDEFNQYISEGDTLKDNPKYSSNEAGQIIDKKTHFSYEIPTQFIYLPDDQLCIQKHTFQIIDPLVSQFNCSEVDGGMLLQQYSKSYQHYQDMLRHLSRLKFTQYFNQSQPQIFQQYLTSIYEYYIFQNHFKDLMYQNFGFNLNYLLQEYHDAVFRQLCIGISLMIIVLIVVMSYTLKKQQNETQTIISLIKMIPSQTLFSMKVTKFIRDKKLLKKFEIF